ncbi:MAG: ATP-binding cassette domain-containing protein [Thermoprotei archaeon]|nr:ATP-binding cassette domain-containing protein [Thermoprotei archaeon]
MLKVEGLQVFIKGIEILRNVSLEVEEGSVVCLLGRNGAGKTTTLKTIMGFYKPSKGKVEVDGADITFKPVHERTRHKIGYAPEDLKIFPWLTVEENIKLAANTAKRDYEEATKKILQTFPELEKLLGRKGYYLSGGEKRMVAIARALAQNPKYLLLDELLEGLAPRVAERLATSLKEIASKGVGVLVAESNVALAKMVTRQVYVIERGEIIYRGSIEDALKDHKVAPVLGLL